MLHILWETHKNSKNPFFHGHDDIILKCENKNEEKIK